MENENKDRDNYIPFLKKMKELFENSGMMAAILDESFQTVWCSAAAKAAFPSLMTAHGVLDLLWGRNVSDIKQEIHANGQFRTPTPDNLFSHPSLTITAINEADYLLMIHPLPFQGSSLQPESLSLVLGAFENGIRSPLSGIFSSLNVLSNMESGQGSQQEKQKQYLAAIEKNSFLLLRGFERVVRYTKLSNRLFTPQKKRIDMWQYLREMCEAAGSLLQPNGIPLFYDIPEGYMNVYCDTGLLDDALFNLISNSARFTKPDNLIEVRAQEVGDMISILVADHGLGIPANALTRVQEPYFSFSYDGLPLSGLGLGLPIAKESAEMLGGTLRISSIEGQGTRVQFTLAKADADNNMPIVRCNAADYTDDRFSILRITLADVLQHP